MADESWTGEWLRQLVAEKSGSEAWDVLRSFRVGGKLVELIHNPDSGYVLALNKDDGKRVLLAEPDQSVRTMLDTVKWSKLKRTGRVW